MSKDRKPQAAQGCWSCMKGFMAGEQARDSLKRIGLSG